MRKSGHAYLEKNIYSFNAVDDMMMENIRYEQRKGSALYSGITITATNMNLIIRLIGTFLGANIGFLNTCEAAC